jgi:hypothetical protein
MKRNIIEEIELKRSRYSDYNAYRIICELKELEREVMDTEIEKSKNYPTIKYIPLIAWSAIESFFQLELKDLIDNNIIDSKRLSFLEELKNFRLTILFTQEMTAKKISLGALISHVINVSNLQNINSVFSTLLNIDFLNDLKSFRMELKYYKTLIDGWQVNSIQVIKDLHSIYRARNILAHEFGFEIDIKNDVLLRYLKNCILFLELSNCYIDNLSQSVKIERKSAKEGFEDSDNKLDCLVEKILDYSNKTWYDMEPILWGFQDEIYLWRLHCKKVAKANCEIYIGTKNYKEMLWTNLEMLTREKVNLLANRYEYLFNEIDYATKIERFI